MPAVAVASTVRMAVCFASGEPVVGVVPVAVGLLTDGVLKAMRWSRLKLFAQGAMAAVVLTVWVGSVVRVVTGSGGTQPTARAPKPASHPPAPVPVVEAQVHMSGTESPEQLLLRCRGIIDKMPETFYKGRLFSELATTRMSGKWRRTCQTG